MTGWNLPPGVRESDVYTDPQECLCGHRDVEHGDDTLGPCRVMDCLCKQFEPAESDWIEAA